MSCLSLGDRAFVVYLGIGRYGKEDTMRVRMASPDHSTELEEAVISVLRSGRLIQGEKVMVFENALAEYLGCKHVIAVSS